MSKNLYVGNLSYSTTHDTLAQIFGEVGQVASINIVTDRMTGRSRGFAFVEMAESAGAQEAINQLNGREVDGRALKVAEARPKSDSRDGGRDSRDSRGSANRRSRY